LDGIFIVAKDHRLVFFNWACEDLYGIHRKDVIDKACRQISDLKRIIVSNFQKGQKLPFGELASNKEREEIIHKNGKRLWIETIYTPILDKETNDIAYVMGVIKDISELKQVQAEKERLKIELGLVRQEMELKFDFSNILGRSQQILQALKLAGQVAKQNTSVMLLGESGTGKELFARAIHQNSQRSSKPFVPVNCAAFPDTLIESELFGYEKGAFTGAEKSRQGKVGLASGGTLLLDEVTELSAPAQAKILRVIQEREFEPLGSVKTIHSDIRVIAATNKDLGQLVNEGLFREDLYYRLFVFPIVIPPLRERPEDLPVLMDHFIQKFNKDMGMEVRGITPEAKEVLLQYTWPGNVRELQNVMERMMILSKNNNIDENILPGYMIEESRETADRLQVNKGLREGHLLTTYLQKFEKQMILDALEKCKFNKTKAASLLGLTRSTFRYKLSKIK
jgi:PAS domain S-box-containing protein